MLRIIKEVYQTTFLAKLFKMFGEFTAVVGLDSLRGKWSHFHKLPKEVTTVGRGVGFVGVGEGESGADVDGSKDIAFDAISKDRDRVHLNEIARVLRSKAVSSRFLSLWFSFSDHQSAGSTIYSDFVRSGYPSPFFKVVDDSAYGRFRYWFYSS